MAGLRKMLKDMNIKEKKVPNICCQLNNAQITGKKLNIKGNSVSTEFLKKMDSRLSLKSIPIMLKQLSTLTMNGEEESQNCVIELLKALSGIQSSDNLLARGKQDTQSSQGIPGFSRASQLIYLFGGFQMILWILFDPFVRPSRDINNLFKTPRHSSTTQLEIRALCLDILHDIFLNVEAATSEASKNDQLIEYLFIMMEERKTFSCASVVLEDLLASNRKIVQLSNIENLHNLIVSLKDNNFASFCRILSVVIADIDFSEDRNTLLAQDKEEKLRAVEKTTADSNQALLLSFPEFLSRMVRLAGKSLPGTSLHQTTRRNLDNVIWNLEPINVDSFLNELATMNTNQDLPDDLNNDDDLMSVIPRRLRYVHEVMYKVEILYVLTLFLNGKSKNEVQAKLGDLKLIPALCDLFDRLGWNNSSERFPTHNHSEAEDCDCTPESALKIQFLRFVHSFCDHSEKKHLLLSAREVDEMHKICEKHRFETPVGLESCKRFRCRGEKGLLSKILDILKQTSPNNALRFWLSRAIEGFLRGSVSPPDQHFLINRNIVEHLLEHILNPETKSKEILQSSFDLLGELIKFNEEAFQRFNRCVTTDAQFDQFISTVTSNVVDSNMFIRCIVLSLERFDSAKETSYLRHSSCRLSGLMKKWEHKMYLMYKLITSISVDNLTQENVSCLNTTLIFLMFAHNHGQLGQYLEAFVTEEQAQHHPGLILANLRDLLEFWRMHYLQRSKDRVQLEQSSCIQFEHWQNLVDVLLHKDNSRITSILHYLLPWQQASTRIRSGLLQRDA